MKYDATYNSKAFCNSLIPITTFAEVFIIIIFSFSVNIILCATVVMEELGGRQDHGLDDGLGHRCRVRG